jgi:hypothetical protein
VPVALAHEANTSFMGLHYVPINILYNGILSLLHLFYFIQTTSWPLLAVLKPTRIIYKRTDDNCSSFHLTVFLGLSNPRDRDRLAQHLYHVLTLVKEKVSLT